MSSAAAPAPATADQLTRGVEDAGLDVEALGGDLQSLRELLEDLGARALQASLDLGQVGVGHPGELGQLTQGEPGGRALFAQVLAEAAAQVVQRVLAHKTIVLALVSKMQTGASVRVLTHPLGARDAPWG